MGIDSYITDPKNHKNAHVITHDDKDSKNALVVATHPLKKYENTIKFFTSDVYGIDMNIGQTVNLTENVHNGTDNIYWTASAIVGGKWTIDSSAQAHTGSQSIESNNGAVNDVLQLAKGSDLDLINYNLLNIWIYVDKDWAAGDNISIYGWDTGTGLMVGNSVNMEDYFSWNVFDTWHKIVIPFSNMTLTGETIDALRIKIITKDVKSPLFYMDDIQFTGTKEEADAREFRIEPELGTWLHVHELSYIIADDDYDSTVTDATLPKIPYNTILGVAALSSGVLYQRVINEEIQFSATIKQLSDILQLSGAEIVAQGSVGATGTWLTIKNEILEPIVLKSENKDKLRFTVNDNLSGLDLLRITAACRIEYRQ